MARSYFDGRDVFIAYGEETDYGSGGTPNGSNTFSKFQGMSLEMSNNKQIDQDAGTGANGSFTRLGNFDCSGSIESKPVDFTFLQYAIGERQGDGSTGSGDYYDLVERDFIGYGSNLTPSLALSVVHKSGSSDQDFNILGTVFTGFTLNGSIGSPLTCTLPFVGRTVTRDTSAVTYSPPSARPFVINNGSSTWNSEVIEITQFSVSCTYVVNSPREVFDRFVKQPTRGVRRYTWTLNMNFYIDDGSYLDATEFLSEFFGSTNSPVNAGPVTGQDLVITVNEGTSTGDQEVIIQLAESQINTWSQNPTLEGGVINVTVSGTSLQGVTESSVNVPIKWRVY